MPKFLEKILKKQYGSNSDIPYKIMNNLGAIKGSQETAVGRDMQHKHDMKMGVVRKAVGLKIGRNG